MYTFLYIYIYIYIYVICTRLVVTEVLGMFLIEKKNERFMDNASAAPKTLYSFMSMLVYSFEHNVEKW